MTRMVRLPKPVIARVHGVATAAGCQLVASCDLAVATANGTFATPGVNIGLFCSTPMVALSRAVGRKAAMEMLLTGELIDAARGARAWSGQPRGAGFRTGRGGYGAGHADRHEKPTHAGHRQGCVLSPGRDGAFDDAYSYVSEVMTRNMLAHDAAEGIDAFLGRREPVVDRGLILPSTGHSSLRVPMAKDPYETLGVQKTDSDAAIRSAYRKLAKRHHPNVNPGKPEAADRFKEISAAYDILSDKDKRSRYDRGEIDAAGNEVPPQRPFYRDSAMPRGGRNIAPRPASTRRTWRASLPRPSVRGPTGALAADGGFRCAARTRQYQLTIDFLDAVNGTTRRVTLPDGRTLDVRIPAGVRDGQIIELKGQGMPELGDGAPGDALVDVTVAPNPLFRREGDDIIVELPVSLQEAVLGTTLEVPTIKGPVRLTIPPNSGTGSRLRLRGRGIEGKGHQFVELHVVVPPGRGAGTGRIPEDLEIAPTVRSTCRHGDPRGDQVMGHHLGHRAVPRPVTGRGDELGRAGLGDPGHRRNRLRIPRDRRSPGAPDP